MLVSDRFSDFGEGATYQDTRIEVRRAKLDGARAVPSATRAGLTGGVADPLGQFRKLKAGSRGGSGTAKKTRRWISGSNGERTTSGTRAARSHRLSGVPPPGAITAAAARWTRCKVRTS